MKKGLVTVLVLIACIGVLLLSYLSWNEKVKEAGAEPVNRPIKQEAPAEGANDQAEDPEEELEKAAAPSGEELSNLTANLPESTVEMLMSRLDSEEPVQLLAVGSSSFEEPANQLADALDDAYGGWIETDVQTFSGTSESFMQDGIGEIDWKKGYDLVVYEPFTLNNNGLVVIEDEQEDALEVRDRVREEVEDAAFFITPPQPIHEPNYYLTQINALHKFVDNRDIPFIDHWKQWPDADSDDILDYVNEEYQPTDKGVEVWAESLKEYFIAS
ncbi:hypothetical protein AV656_08350 [Bhargavaea cecembensis]|uniref:SGNH hydrolase-type esterase domain-containing protein n=1 Tax=Bhargavaea cecembensis TaxID=394098 RepID=A0A163FLI5_9BACL|nr:hypothetical protein [Bhargavaea cecembensis]KZE38901.1 hypothetical protein AV656_08350 [Bhargavaea cecembensis]